MRKRVKVFGGFPRPMTLAVTLLAVTLTGPLWADRIVLKNGNEIRGKILKKGRHDYIVAVPYGRMTIPVRRVKEVIPEEESEYLRATGAWLLRVRDHKKGLTLLRQARESNPDSEACRQALVDGLLTATRNTLQVRSLAQATRLLDEAAGIAPDSPSVSSVRSEIAAVEARCRELVDSAEERWATQDIPGAYETYHELLREFPEQRQRGRPRLARLAVLMGHVHLGEGDAAQARDLYREALTLEPDLISVVSTPLVYCEVTTVVPLLEKGEFKEAIVRLEEARGLTPDEPAILYHLGLALEGSGELSKAADLYAILAGPDRQPIDGPSHLVKLRHLAEEALAAQQGTEMPTGDPRWHNAPRAPGKRETAHFVIHHQNARLAREAGRHLEHHLERLTRSWFRGNTFRGLKRKVEIFLHPDKETFLAQSSAPSWANGLTTAERRYGAILGQAIHFNVSSPQFLAAELPHELTHVMLPYRLGTRPLPPWMEEGLATSEEPRYKQAYYGRVVRDAARAGTLFSIEELFASGDYPEESRVDVFYAQANSVVRFLRERFGSRGTFTLLRALVETSPEEAVTERRRFASLADLERRWLAWAIE